MVNTRGEGRVPLGIRLEQVIDGLARSIDVARPKGVDRTPQPRLTVGIHRTSFVETRWTPQVRICKAASPMRQSMQRIVPGDEYLNHQIAETHATIAESDLSWTEKVWTTLFARDGSLQLSWSLGKYHNRNVVDAAGGISRGTQQWTIRASRRLDADPERIGAGPLDCEIVAPLESVRFRLGENEVLPLRFDVVTTALMPPFLEQPDRQREQRGYRVSSDLLRWHQAVSCRGWVEIDGERVDIADDDWFGFRDRAWGVRMNVGLPVPDLAATDRHSGRFLLRWSPLMFERPDGTRYEIHHYVQEEDGKRSYFSGFVNEPDGTQTPIHDIRDELRFDLANRRLLGGSIELDMGWGETRTLVVEPLGATGFHLGPAGYFAFKGKAHGSWLGEDFLDGERYDDVSDPQVAREVHQLRDCPVRAREGGAYGIGIVETILTGAHPRYGLDAESSFL